MVKKVIGLDIGTSAVRAAQVSAGATPVLLRFGQVALPPGAMREGEVVDPEAVAAALRRLWQELGLRDQRVHLGIASRRVFVRAVELPQLPEADTRSALRLQLGDYVPFPAEDMVFDFRPASRRPPPQGEPPNGADGDGPPGAVPPGGEPVGELQRVLLGAAHRAPVDALLDAVRRAGLRPVSLEPLPCALARAFADGPGVPTAPAPPAFAALTPSAEGAVSLLTPSSGNVDGALSGRGAAIDPLAPGPLASGLLASPLGSDQDVSSPPVASQLIVSVGAGTVMVIGTLGDEALFSRTITHLAGGALTERLAASLGVDEADAEVAKRCAAVGDHPELPIGTTVAVAAMVDELVEEISRSVGYYLSQVGAVPPQRVVLTGAGLSLPGLSNRLVARLELPVVSGDLLATLPTRDLGFGPAELAALAPVAPAPVGLALGGRAGAGRIDLLRGAVRPASVRRTRILVATGAVAVLALGGAYLHEVRSVSSERASLADLRAQVATANTTPAGGDGTAGAVSARTVVAAASPADLDWLAVLRRLDDLSRPLGVELGGRQGNVDAAAEASSAAPKGGTAAPASNVGGSTTTTAVGASAAKVAGSMRLDASAPNVGAVAAWLDAVSADAYFTDAWVDSVTPSDGGVSFVGHVSLTEATHSSRLDDLLKGAQ